MQSRETAARAFNEKAEKEKEKLIKDLQASVEDMKRKAEQGSMETQGEVLEQDFEAQLKAFFVHDDIQPVPKGIKGADLVQTVRTPIGAECGILLWETKNTKAFSSAWIPKLKDDMIEIRASIAILVSVVLPDGINRFGQVDGVWVVTCGPGTCNQATTDHQAKSPGAFANHTNADRPRPAHQPATLAWSDRG